MDSIAITLERYNATSMKVKCNDFDTIIGRPISEGGNGEGLMGGQYLLTSIGGCFCSNLNASATARYLILEKLEVQITAFISNDKPKHFSEIDLKVSCDCSDNKLLNKVILIAKKTGIAINTLNKGTEINACL
jgi:uncharacterized OsmC-like protein